MTILATAQEAGGMVHNKSKRTKAKTILRLPDLEQSKTAVLHSLGAASSQESYRHAIDEFIGWYCSEPRLAFNRTVVLRYRFFLEQRNLAPSTINVRLAAVRRLAYEAADTGLLSPELAAGIRRVKGAKRLGVRIGNWLSIDQARDLMRGLAMGTARGKRDRAILALLIGCGLRRAELVALTKDDFQLREDHWVLADLIGKGKHIRTVPVPAWAKRAVDDWTEASGANGNPIFRRVNRQGKVWGAGSPQKQSGMSSKRRRPRPESRTSHRMISVVHVRDSAIWREENWSRYSSSSVTRRLRQPRNI
jgi:site-specific recombinase XerC